MDGGGHGAQGGAGLEAIHPGHEDVEQDDVGHGPLAGLQTGLAAVGLLDLETGVAQAGAHEQAQGRIVVDQQHLALVLGRRCRADRVLRAHA